jgi:putative membrane protein
MKLFLGLGKVVALLFWLVVLINLFAPFTRPFNVLLNVAGGLLLTIHLMELAWFTERLKGRSRPWLDRLQLLSFGVFHLVTLPKPRRKQPAKKPAAKPAAKGAKHA